MHKTRTKVRTYMFGQSCFICQTDTFQTVKGLMLGGGWQWSRGGHWLLPLIEELSDENLLFQTKPTCCHDARWKEETGVTRQYRRGWNCHPANGKQMRGINSGKSAVVVWKNLPYGGPSDTQIYPKVNLKPPKGFSQGKHWGQKPKGPQTLWVFGLSSGQGCGRGFAWGKYTQLKSLPKPWKCYTTPGCDGCEILHVCNNVVQNINVWGHRSSTEDTTLSHCLGQFSLYFLFSNAVKTKIKIGKILDVIRQGIYYTL